MTLRESDAWAYLRDRAKHPDWDFMRVENPAMPGTPDVNWCHYLSREKDVALEGWLELKKLNSWPVRASTLVRIPHYTPQQSLWAEKRSKYGRRIQLLLRVGEPEWLLFDGLMAAKVINKTTRQGMIDASLAHWTDGLNVEELKTWLLRKPTSYRR